MYTLQEAAKVALVVSREFPTKIVRVYETVGGAYWIRFDSAIVETVEGIELAHVISYNSGSPLVERD